MPDSDVPYHRETLVEVVIYHWRRENSGCGCGWGCGQPEHLGMSWAEHIADVYEQSALARL